ncbi:oxidoreductase [Balneola sp. EhC07]|uniref:aldo/keto reductase n=1 Tax=Balneola sp. EhC07 TaxID=1849360 RepID=UPI0007F3E6CB|nr:aldo/keto reductase [Balneola sp. EhC07]OAN60830.1 oxidoreductase [Balneola sp. EhC07]
MNLPEPRNIGFGCMSLDPKSSDNIELLRSAVDKGITFFDTADLYDKGWNEEIVGKALSPFRKRVRIATKVGNEWNESGTDWRWNPSKEYILKTVDKSLERLQTDYIDLYQLHGGTLDDPIDETIEAFEILKEQGKILNYGISSIRPNVIEEWIKRSNMSSVMMQYSLLDRRPEEECLDMLNKSDISVITRGTLAKGMLIDKPAKEYLGYSEQEVKLMQKAVSKTKNSLSASIQYVNKHPAVESAIIGIRTMEQLDEVIKSQSVTIPSEMLTELSEVLKPNMYEKHR